MDRKLKRALIVIVVFTAALLASCAKGNRGQKWHNRWDSVSEIAEGKYVVESDGKYGMVDEHGAVTIPPEWDRIECAFTAYDAESQLLNPDPMYWLPDCVLQDHFLVWKDGKVGCTTDFGPFITHPQWDEMSAFFGSYSIVRTDGKYGLLRMDYLSGDRDGECGRLVLEPEYSDLWLQDDGTIFARKESSGKWGVLSLDGSVRIPFKWDDIESIKAGYIVSKGGKKGLLDHNGKRILKPVWDDIIGLEDTRYQLVVRDAAMAVYDCEKDILASAPGKFIASYYYYDCEGIPTMYYDDEKKLCGYFGVDGSIVIRPVFKWADKFYGDYAVVGLTGGEDALIDKRGEVLCTAPKGLKIEVPVDPQGQSQNALFYVQGEPQGGVPGRLGVLSAKDGLIIEPEWDDITLTASGNMLAERDGETVLFSPEGEQLGKWAGNTKRKYY